MSTIEGHEGAALRSVVFRLPRARMEAVKDLAHKTRITQSVLLREAISDLLAKYPPPEGK